MNMNVKESNKQYKISNGSLKQKKSLACRVQRCFLVYGTNLGGDINFGLIFSVCERKNSFHKPAEITNFLENSYKN